MDKTYFSTDLAEGIPDGTNSTKVRDLNCLRADLTWFWGTGSGKAQLRGADW
jgi:hypothetical protein